MTLADRLRAERPALLTAGFTPAQITRYVTERWAIAASALPDAEADEAVRLLLGRFYVAAARGARERRARVRAVGEMARRAS